MLYIDLDPPALIVLKKISYDSFALDLICLTESEKYHLSHIILLILLVKT